MDIKPTYNQMEEKVRELEGLIENIGTPMMLFDNNGVIRMINRSAADILGGRPDNFIGRTIPDLSPDNSAQYVQRIRDVFKTGRPESYEDKVRVVSGDKWFFSNYIPVFNEDRVVHAVQVVFIDITDKRHAEEGLKKSEEIFSLFMEHSPNYVFFKDESIRAIRLSRNYEQMLGMPLEKLIGKTMDELFPSALAKSMIEDDKRVLKEGKPVRVEEELNGRFYETIKFPILIEGNPKYLAGYTTDITEQKRAKDKLEANLRFLQALLDTIPSPIFFIDTECRYLGGNRAYFDEIIGIKIDEIIGRTVYDLPHHISKELADEYHKQDMALLNAGGTQVYEASVRCSDNKIRDFIFYKSTFLNAEGETAGIVGMMLDITDRKRDEEEKAMLQKRLQQAEKMESIGTLAGGIAHDFNNILFPILAYAELTAMGLPSDSPLQQNVKQIYRSAERARDLVRQILTFARHQEKEKIPINVSQILKETVILLRSSIPSTIDIRYNISKGHDNILADPTQISQIIMNLSTNAAHAMEANGGSLELDLGIEELGNHPDVRLNELEPGSYVRLSIKDTGHGIDPQIIDKIFEPYFTTKERGKGTGMGLAIVHGIVKSYGGEITVQSDVGKGSVFNVYLPLLEKDATALKTMDAGMKYPTGIERILLVDDEKAALDVMKTVLETLGYKVTSRTSSIEALEAFRHNPQGFDLVITDQTMPNMTGKTLAKEIMAIRHGMPIILCTGYSEQIDEKKAEEMGISAFVMKPIVIGQIAEAIRAALDKNR